MELADVIRRLAFLGYVATPEDEANILYLASKVERDICNLCNIAEVPSELFFVAVDLVCREFLFARRASGTLEGFNAQGAVKSLREGDTAIAFGGASDDKAVTFETLLELLALGKREQLLRFRRFAWP